MKSVKEKEERNFHPILKSFVHYILAHERYQLETKLPNNYLKLLAAYFFDGKEKETDKILLTYSKKRYNRKST